MGGGWLGAYLAVAKPQRKSAGRWEVVVVMVGGWTGSDFVR